MQKKLREKHMVGIVENPEPLKVAIIPLSHPNLRRIRKGKYIKIHFHGSNCSGGIITFFVGLKDIVPGPASLEVLSEEEIGDVSSLPISTTQIDQIEFGMKSLCWKIEKEPPIEVFLVNSKVLNKLNQDKKKIGNKN